jgi:hypothetical protein
VAVVQVAADHPTPEDVFRLAQEAMRRGDWEAFFALLSLPDLQRLAAFGVAATTGSDGAELRALCLRHDAPTADLDHVQHLALQVIESAGAILHSGAVSAEETLERSIAHRDLVRAQSAAITTCVASMRKLPTFVAAVERLRRERHGGGSVSSTLFVDETLLNVVVTGDRAVGTRRRPRGADEPIAFVRRRGRWQIVLFARPRRR